MIQIVLIVLTLFITTILLFYMRPYYYSNNETVLVATSLWKKTFFPFSQFLKIFSWNKSVAILLQNKYNRYKSQLKICKFYILFKEYYSIQDREYIKCILNSDFRYFTDRGFYYNEKRDPISANLFALDNPKWNLIRNKLTPTFTSAKLKMMFETMLECSHQMMKHLDGLKNGQVDITDLAISHSMDVISSCAFGLDCNCVKNSGSEFKKNGKKVFEFSLWKVFKSAFAFSYPDLSRKLGITLFDEHLNDFFIGITRDVINSRLQNGTQRNDMIQLMMKLDETTSRQINFEEITAQVFIFFAAGFETTSITLSYCLYELSINLDVQENLRREIKETLSRYDGNLTYDALMKMKYMSQVIDETLRKYPPVPYLFRKCVQDYKFSDSEYTIMKGNMILISVLGLHHDPDYFPNPDKFDPDRFSTKNKSKIPPYAYMPFGEGPRLCLGLRFALLQVKTALAGLLMKYSLTLNAETITPIPVKKLSFALAPAKKVILNFNAL